MSTWNRNRCLAGKGCLQGSFKSHQDYELTEDKNVTNLLDWLYW